MTGAGEQTVSPEIVAAYRAAYATWEAAKGTDAEFAAWCAMVRASDAYLDAEDAARRPGPIGGYAGRLYAVYHIECGECDRTVSMARRGAAAHFRAIGWRKRGGRWLCPQCASGVNESGISQHVPAGGIWW
jgi:hypothetical protein